MKHGVFFHTEAELQESRRIKYSDILPHPYYRGKIVLQLRSQQVGTLFPARCWTACVVLDQRATSCASLLHVLHGDNYVLAKIALWCLFVDLVCEGRRWWSTEGNYQIKRRRHWRAISLFLAWVLHAVVTDGCIAALLQHRWPVQRSTFLFPKVTQRCKEKPQKDFMQVPARCN